MIKARKSNKMPELYLILDICPKNIFFRFLAGHLPPKIRGKMPPSPTPMSIIFANILTDFKKKFFH